MIDSAKEKWSNFVQEVMGINDPRTINETSIAAILRRIMELLNEKPTFLSSNAEHSVENRDANLGS